MFSCQGNSNFLGFVHIVFVYLFLISAFTSQPQYAFLSS